MQIYLGWDYRSTQPGVTAHDPSPTAKTPNRKHKPVHGMKRKNPNISERRRGDEGNISQKWGHLSLVGVAGASLGQADGVRHRKSLRSATSRHRPPLDPSASSLARVNGPWPLCLLSLEWVGLEVKKEVGLPTQLFINEQGHRSRKFFFTKTSHLMFRHVHGVLNVD